jgi:hypothetical protein
MFTSQYVNVVGGTGQVDGKPNIYRIKLSGYLVPRTHTGICGSRRYILWPFSSWLFNDTVSITIYCYSGTVVTTGQHIDHVETDRCISQSMMNGATHDRGFGWWAGILFKAFICVLVRWKRTYFGLDPSLKNPTAYHSSVVVKGTMVTTMMSLFKKKRSNFTRLWSNVFNSLFHCYALVTWHNFNSILFISIILRHMYLILTSFWHGPLSTRNTTETTVNENISDCLIHGRCGGGGENITWFNWINFRPEMLSIWLLP